MEDKSRHPIFVVADLLGKKSQEEAGKAGNGSLPRTGKTEAEQIDSSRLSLTEDHEEALDRGRVVAISGMEGD